MQNYVDSFAEAHAYSEIKVSLHMARVPCSTTLHLTLRNRENCVEASALKFRDQVLELLPIQNMMNTDKLFLLKARPLG